MYTHVHAPRKCYALIRHANTRAHSRTHAHTHACMHARTTHAHAQVTLPSTKQAREQKRREAAANRELNARRKARPFFVDVKVLFAFKVATPQQTNSVDCALYVHEITCLQRDYNYHHLAHHAPTPTASS